MSATQCPPGNVRMLNPSMASSLRIVKHGSKSAPLPGTHHRSKGIVASPRCTCLLASRASRTLATIAVLAFHSQTSHQLWFNVLLDIECLMTHGFCFPRFALLSD